MRKCMDALMGSVANSQRTVAISLKKSVNASKFQREKNTTFWYYFAIFVIFFVQICQFEDVKIVHFMQQFVDLQN